VPGYLAHVTLAFAVASALHAGFQVTVTLLVYPALAAQPPERWQAAHERHSRAITPLVVLVYGALLVTGAATALSGTGVAGWVGLAGAAAAMGVTATVAGPAHGRLVERDERLVVRLLVADRWRCAAAVLGAVAAVVAAS
jgi:hypothetical protein